MVLLLVAKPVDGWCSVDVLKAISILSNFVPKRAPSPFAKEEDKKEDKKEEKPKEEPKEEKPEVKTESKRSGGYVKSADGCVIRGKTKGRMV